MRGQGGREGGVLCNCNSGATGKYCERGEWRGEGREGRREGWRGEASTAREVRKEGRGGRKGGNGYVCD